MTLWLERRCDLKECLWVSDQLPGGTPFLKCLRCDKQTTITDPRVADDAAEVAKIRRERLN